MEILGPYLFLPLGVLLVLGTPVAVAIGLACLIFITFSGTPIPPNILMGEMYSSLTQFALLALPMFVVAGELMNRIKVTDALIELAQSLVGWIKGGLAHVNILASMLFAGISGSIFGDIASIGTILIPSMIKERFPRGFSAGVTAASSVIGAIIPPSTTMIIVGSQLGISIGGLFAAGILPGLIIGLALMLVALVISYMGNYGEVRRFPGVIRLSRSTFKALPALFIPVWLLGGILSGVFTPTESAAAIVLYILLLGAFYYRTLTLSSASQAIVASVRITASSLFIVGAAFVFSRILSFYKLPEEILNLLLSISDDRAVMILIILALFIVVGTFMDALANMIILGPLLMPVMVGGLEMHPLQFGMVLMVGNLLGLLTPPLGICLFLVSPIARIPVERVALAVIPFFSAQIAILIAMAFIPGITLFFPRLLGLI